MGNTLKIPKRVRDDIKAKTFRKYKLHSVSHPNQTQCFKKLKEVRKGMDNIEYGTAFGVLADDEQRDPN